MYFSGVEVAKNMQEGTLDFGKDAGINIGFRASILHLPLQGVWSGLMDDVRIYGRVLSAEEIEAIVQ
ncbi:LamG-like jellyroll fold domain-containing protein [Planctomycetota bacterium]